MMHQVIETESLAQRRADRHAARAAGWCILRTGGPRTLALAKSLGDAGFETWTPRQTVKRPVPGAKPDAHGRRPTQEVDALMAELIERNIDVLIVDPFVSSHQVSENDNRAIDMVAKQWAMIADRCNCSINLVHHVRKANGQEANADSARGAKSLTDAARSVMVYNRMTKEEAELAGVAPEQVGFHFRVQNDKANLAPSEAADWYRMNNVELENGDEVGVACSWSWPDTFAGVTTDKLMAVQRAVAEGEWRENSRSAEKWVGVPVARVLGLSTDKDRVRLNKIIKQWLETDALRLVERKDANRIMRNFVEVGTWVSE